MKNNMLSRKVSMFLVLVLFTATTITFGQGNAPSSLNGQKFKLELVDEQNNVTFDMITFKETSFSTNAIKNSTYNTTRYAVKEQPDGKLFLFAEAYSETEGTITYKGHLEAGKLSGAMFTDKPGHPQTKRMFNGDMRVEAESQD